MKSFSTKLFALLSPRGMNGSMSITTKRGDDGQTDLLFGRRITKTSSLLVAMGAVDELNAALGLARVAKTSDSIRSTIDSVQEKLVGLMGELATHPDDEEKYNTAGYPRITAEDIATLETTAKATESDLEIRFKGWARPGKEASEPSARLDMARTICRRAERELWSLETANPQARLYLNRLSDLLWVYARAAALEA